MPTPIPLLSDYIVSFRLLAGGPARSKPEVIHHLLEQMAADSHVAPSDVDNLYEAVLRREALGTTGIGTGIAIPHARYAALTRSIAILAVCRPSVDFESLDGEPVDIIVLCLGATDPSFSERRDSQRRAERLLRCLVNPEFRDRLRKVTSALEIRDHLAAMDDGEI